MLQCNKIDVVPLPPPPRKIYSLRKVNKLSYFQKIVGLLTNVQNAFVFKYHLNY